MCLLAQCQTSSDPTGAKTQQGFCLDPLAPVGYSTLTSSLSGSPCLEHTTALMHFEAEGQRVELLKESESRVPLRMIQLLRISLLPRYLVIALNMFLCSPFVV